jgi:cob(I)alamin adenosyltransferase
MVYLNRIYTKTGDSGETSLGDGRRVKKTDLRIAAYGGVDELNAVIGLTVASGLNSELTAMLRHIQNDLFDLGADLCVPEPEIPPQHPPLRVTSDQVDQLECWIDAQNERLSPLTSFILPGGSLAAAHLHLARTVCRRVEIDVLELAARDQINSHVVIYLNRLSDLLFVLSRVANQDGRDDVLWVPGRNRRGPP